MKIHETDFHSNDFCTVTFAGSPSPILEYNILKNFAWKVDHRKRMIYFTSHPDIFDITDCSSIIPFKIKDNQPYVKCKINGVNHDLVLDTGAPDIFINVSVHDRTGEGGNYQMKRAEESWSFTVGHVKIRNLSFDNELISHHYHSDVIGLDLFSALQLYLCHFRLHQRQALPRPDKRLEILSLFCLFG